MSDLKNALIEHADAYDIDDLDAFAVYVEYLGGFEYIEQAAVDFADAYQGWWNSLEEFVFDLVSETEPDLIEAMKRFGIEFQIETIAWEQDYYLTEEGYLFRTHV